MPPSAGSSASTSAFQVKANPFELAPICNFFIRSTKFDKNFSYIKPMLHWSQKLDWIFFGHFWSLKIDSDKSLKNLSELDNLQWKTNMKDSEILDIFPSLSILTENVQRYVQCHFSDYILDYFAALWKICIKFRWPDEKITCGWHSLAIN